MKTLSPQGFDKKAVCGRTVFGRGRWPSGGGPLTAPACSLPGPHLFPSRYVGPCFLSQCCLTLPGIFLFNDIVRHFSVPTITVSFDLVVSQSLAFGFPSVHFYDLCCFSAIGCLPLRRELSPVGLSEPPPPLKVVPWPALLVGVSFLDAPHTGSHWLPPSVWPYLTPLTFGWT